MKTIIAIAILLVLTACSLSNCEELTELELAISEDTSEDSDQELADEIPLSLPDKRSKPIKTPAWINSLQRCGQTKYSIQKRIVGGVESRPHEWPWLVSLQLRKHNRLLSDHLCGGTLISRQFILTSAHCFENKWHAALTTDPSMWLARLGEHNLRASDRTEKQPEIEKIILHAERDPSKSLNNDIALVKLKCPVNLTGEIGIACLPEYNASVSTGDTCVTIGWGTTAASDRKSVVKMTHMDKVRHVEVPIVNKDRCRESYAAVSRRRLNINISDETICASNMDGTVRDACQYDSGGPLMCREGVVNGVVSFGNGCGRMGFPGIYANVSVHLDWIYNTINAEFTRCSRSIRRSSSQCGCF